MEDNLIDIRFIDKAKIIQALYNNSKPLGMGFLHFDPKPMSYEEAHKIVDEYGYDFDYLKGRVMKVNVSKDTLDPWLYDRDNGEGAALRALKSLMDERDKL